MTTFIVFVIWYLVGFISLCAASVFIDSKEERDFLASLIPILSMLGFLALFCLLLVGAYFALYKLATISVGGTLALSKKLKLFISEISEGGDK